MTATDLTFCKFPKSNKKIPLLFVMGTNALPTKKHFIASVHLNLLITHIKANIWNISCKSTTSLYCLISSIFFLDKLLYNNTYLSKCSVQIWFIPYCQKQNKKMRTTLSFLSIYVRIWNVRILHCIHILYYYEFQL